jgi:hypothetical protein
MLIRFLGYFLESGLGLSTLMLVGLRVEVRVRVGVRVGVRVRVRVRVKVKYLKVSPRAIFCPIIAR